MSARPGVQRLAELIDDGSICSLAVHRFSMAKVTIMAQFRHDASKPMVIDGTSIEECAREVVMRKPAPGIRLVAEKEAGQR